jgi:uncharacterized membrane protein
MALPLATLLAGRPGPGASSVGYPLALAVYAAGSLICHQQPARSFHMVGTQMPVCARCVGLYVGAALAAVALTVAGSGDRRGHTMEIARFVSRRRALVAAALPMGLTIAYELATGRAPANWVRAVSGMPAGSIVAWVVCTAGQAAARAGVRS